MFSEPVLKGNTIQQSQFRESTDILRRNDLKKLAKLRKRPRAHFLDSQRGRKIMRNEAPLLFSKVEIGGSMLPFWTGSKAIWPQVSPVIYALDTKAQ